MKTLSLCGAVCGIALSLGSFADDGKVYNSGSCFVKPGSFGTVKRGNMFNDSSAATLRTECFAVKDSINHDIKSAWIEVKDLSLDQDVSCTLRSRYNKIGQSGEGSWSITKKTSGINSDWQKLSYGSLSAKDNSRYYFSCDVPKKSVNGTSWLGAYEVEENT